VLPKLLEEWRQMTAALVQISRDRSLDSAPAPVNPTA
jgi:hypothetical protein